MDKYHYLVNAQQIEEFKDWYFTVLYFPKHREGKDKDERYHTDGYEWHEVDEKVWVAWGVNRVVKDVVILFPYQVIDTSHPILVDKQKVLEELGNSLVLLKLAQILTQVHWYSLLHKELRLYHGYIRYEQLYPVVQRVCLCILNTPITHDFIIYPAHFAQILIGSEFFISLAHHLEFLMIFLKDFLIVIEKLSEFAKSVYIVGRFKDVWGVRSAFEEGFRLGDELNSFEIQYSRCEVYVSLVDYLVELYLQVHIVLFLYVYDEIDACNYHEWHEDAKHYREIEVQNLGTLLLKE